MAETLAPSYSSGNRAFADSDTGIVRLSLLFAIHAVVWTIASCVYRPNLDWAGDMLENYSWGIEWQAGYYKHPPFFAWMTAAWFSVFPHTDAAYFALSMINVVIGLCGIAALARRFLPPPEAALAGLAMAVSPIYTTLAIKFNANTVLLSIWPWTAYFFVRYVQTGARKAALALGVAAGIAMLGKYFSMTLLAGLTLAALVRPVWRARLLRRESLLGVIAGTIVLAPHLHWLVASDMPTFSYATERMQEIVRPLPLIVRDMVVYTLVQVAYMLPGMVFLLLLARQHRGRAIKLMLHGYFQRSLNRDLWWLSVSTLLAIYVLALLTRSHVSSLWGTAQWLALPVFWLAVLANAGIRFDTRRVPAVMAAYHDKLAMEPRAELARAAHEAWRARVAQPLAIVAGNVKEARSIAFYATGRIRYWDMFDPATTPWLHADDLRRQGALFVCRGDDVDCQVDAATFTGVPPDWVAVHKTVWGFSMPERRYALYFLRPSGMGPGK